jgi:hypothetical protein
MIRTWLLLLSAALVLGGCDEATAPRDVRPPAAPRGLYSVTGDGMVTLNWVDNTESDFSGYRVYQAACASGGGCPYTLVGATTGTVYVVSGLTNGLTRYFAVSAVDRTGNESPLSYADVFDTPRPEGFNRTLTNALTAPATSGWDFSSYAGSPVVAWDDPATDMYFTTSGGGLRIVCPYTDTEIQDAGYATTLDAVDFAPPAGWSPTGTVEGIANHCYVVKAGTHYAKFRVTSVASGSMIFDWAYQVDPGNPELRARPDAGEGGRVRRTLAL